MDANSIITQVSRDDEQLNAFTNEKGIYFTSLHMHKNIFIKIFC